ncbi:MAG: thiolase family protein [Candidatus Dormibacteraeota bacterium]|uniref:Thiolase family protein n=1 Tax=Candidatus Dormiibacter inghamiae TaxID=3127013 RepID=A0A934NHD5_9BACT|nr:thiolase family protein [Candidatus Dormibacteraeota bacterium]MBJ7606554.1 thiolase family protein [Candidatus Dormibacteraeota bacterium]
MREAVIVEAVRTPMGKRNGQLRDLHPVLLGSLLLQGLLGRAELEPAAVDDVIFGCVTQTGEQGLNVGRNAWLTAGFPVETPATTVDRQCGSSQQAIHFAASLVQSGAAEVVVAGGVESMTRVPMGSNVTQGPGMPYPPELLERYDLVPQGLSAELMARKYGISREAMDEFSVQSHRRAAAATREGRLASQILPVETPENGHSRAVTVDEGIRPGASYEAVAALRPAFSPDHSITAGNSSQITDGAAAVLVTSPEKAKELGLKPRARIAAHRVVGCDPVLMLEGPIPGTAAVLKAAGLALADIDLFEINEAFASVVLAWAQETGAPLKKTNVNGGAIALGHPLGASGARLMCHLLYELEAREQRYGLQAMCCGGGLGTATIIERLP